MVYLLKPLSLPSREELYTIDSQALYVSNRSPWASELISWLPPPKFRVSSSSIPCSCKKKAFPSSSRSAFPCYFKSRVSQHPSSSSSCKFSAPSCSSISSSQCKSRVSLLLLPESYSYCKCRGSPSSSCKFRVSSSSSSSWGSQSQSTSPSLSSPFSSCYCNSKFSTSSLSSLPKSRVSSSSSSYNNGVEGETSSTLHLLPWVDVSRREAEIAGRAASTIMLAVANKLLYKMALVPLRDYPFLLALITTFGYVLVYFTILCMRYQAGIVTDEMLELPKYYFVLSGALEACGVASGMAAAAILPGPSISILLQTFLVWQLLLSMVFLKRRYSLGQIVGCIMVLVGVIIALSGSGMELSVSGGRHMSLFWPLLMMASCAFQASSTIVKEFVFCNACKNLKGGSVDIFVVNSFGSAFQAIFVVLMLPFLSHLRGIPFGQLHNYLKDGAGCLFNIGSRSTECFGAMPLVFGFVVANLAFNISLLSLLKMSSAVVSSLCSTIAVPLTIFVFTLPLPYLGASGSLHPRFLVGTIILLSGLACYNYHNCFKPKLKNICDDACDSEVFHQGK